MGYGYLSRFYSKQMKLELTYKQWRDIQFALCIALSHTEKHTNLNIEDHPLIKRYIKTYDQISEAIKKEKINDSWKEVLSSN